MSGPPARFRLLLIDDTDALRTLVGEALEADSRFSVVGSVGDGLAGIEAARELQPDSIVLDLAMPTMDGIEALPQIRAVAPAARVVVLSGFRHAPFAPALLAGGAVGYLEKGVSAVELRQQILRVLGTLDAVEPVVRSAATSLEHSTSAPWVARQFLDQVVADIDDASAFADIRLLTSELVTNAVMHTGSAPQVVVQVFSTMVRVEVHDTSTDVPQIRTPVDGVPGGRGLQLVADMAAEWGVERRKGGKAVWFHYDLRATHDLPPALV